MAFMNIDGSQGEGGGQILRTSLALSIITGTPIHIENIRARRKKPGLMRQHLTAVLAAAEISGAEVQGATLKSGELWFRPGPVRGGEYHFSVGTAGSACLVFQTVLPPLLCADTRSRVVFEGGTHNPMSPPLDFITRSFLPVLGRMGASVQVQLERPGFFPAGGGRFVAAIEPWTERTQVELLVADKIRNQRARALIAQLKRDIAVRELRVIREHLGWHSRDCAVEVMRNSRGPGNVVLCEVERGSVTAMICAFGQKGIRAERVAKEAAERTQAFIHSGVPVCEYLADQLMLPMALAGGGRYLTMPLSLHSKTNRDVIGMFLDLSVDIEETATGNNRIVNIARLPAVRAS